MRKFDTQALISTKANTQTGLSRLMLLVVMMLLTVGINSLQAQLTGTKTIPGTYATLALAISDLNTQGVGAGGVTFNIAAGYTETLSGRLDITATGTVANPVIFQKSGAGANPVITSYTGTATATSAAMDGMIALIGSDYVTFDGINLQEAAANTDATTTMEYGYGLFKASATDGANNNTIKNCTITLNRINNTVPTTGPAFQGSNGITLLNCTQLAMQTAITVTATSGASSNNKFYSNTIQNVNNGICLSGYAGATPFTLCDTGNDVGGSSAATGNTIINFGGGTGATNACAAVYVKDQWSFNVSYNTVNNNNGSGVNHPTTNRGIFAFASSVGASATMNNNNVTITGGASTSAIDWAIDCEMAQSGAAGNTISINNNTLSMTKTVASTVALTAIWVNSAATTVNVSGNTITNFSTAGTGTTEAILSQLSGIGTLNITNNIINGVSLTGATGSHYNIGVTASVVTALNITGNVMNGVTLTGATSKVFRGIYISTAATTCAHTVSNNGFQNISYSGGTPTGEFAFIYAGGSALSWAISNNTLTGSLTVPSTGTMYFIYNSQSTANGTVSNNNLTGTGITRSGASGATYGYYNASSPTGTFTFSGNTYSNVTVTGSGLFYGIYLLTSTSCTQKVQNNTFSNITIGAGTLYGINHNYGNTGSEISGNTVTNLTGAGTVAGINIGSTASITMNVFNNNVNTITTTGAATATGILHAAGTNTNIYKNKIYNITGNNASASASGLTISSGTTVTAYNNLIGDIKTPQANAAIPLTGINVSGGTTVNLYNNTVNLNASSTGALFGSAAVYASTTPTLTMRNNVFVNNSIPKGATGFTAAYRRTSTTLTTYGATSNNNLFFAGAPCTNNLIFYDGTNSDQTLAAYKTRVAARDAASVTEDPNYTSTTGSAAGFLHINTGIATQIESGGASIATVTDDYDGDARNASTPDIGADEFNGIAAAACAGTPTAGTISPSVSTICSGFSATLCLSGQSAATGISLQWRSATTAGGPYTDISCAGSNCYNTGPLTPGTYYYICVVTCTNSGLTATSNEVSVVVNTSPTASINPSAPTICAGVPTLLTASGGSTYLWSTGATTAAITVSPLATTTYSVTVADAIGCTGSASATVTVNPAPALTTTATPASICSGGTSNLLTTITNADYSVLPITFAPVAIPGSGVTTLVTAGNATVPVSSGTLDDGYWSGITLPFTFTFYGTAYTTGTIGTNGNFHFGTSTTGGYNNVFPSTTSPNAVIGGVFADLDFRILGAAVDGTLRYFTDGVAPNRRFVLDYTNVGFYNSGLAQTSNTSFQILLYEGSNNIEVHVAALNNTTTNKVEGIENAAGTSAVTVSGRNNTLTWTGVPDAYKFFQNYTYNWSPATFLSATNIANPVASNVTATTTYTVTVTASNGCSTTGTATVTVGPVITTSVTETSGVANNDGIICAGATASLTATGGVTYAWSTGGNTATINVTPASTTTYTVTVTDASSCSATSTRTITVNPIPSAGITIAETSGTTPNDGQICAGASADLTATGGGTYAWSTGANTATISVNATGLYTVTVTNAGCTASTSTSITVNPLPTPGTTVAETSGAVNNDGTICAGASAIITGTGGTSYAWSTGANTAAITVSPVSTTTYTVTVTNASGCTATTTSTITVVPVPGLSTTQVEPTTCVSTDGSINLTVSPAGTYGYAWSNSATSEDISGLAVGTYTVTVTNTATGCTSTTTVTLNGPGGCGICPTIPTVTAAPSPVCVGKTVTLTASGLTSMGNTFGIVFVSFSAATGTPYMGGTVLATVANGSLTSAGTVATATVSFPAAGTNFIYAILTPTPSDPVCRPSGTTTLVVNPLPTPGITIAETSGTINNDGVICAGATATLTGTGGTSYAWSNGC